jgi:NAD(P)H-hydrate epimerase
VKLTLQRLVELVSPAEHPEWLVHLHEGCLLTPHVKEFERLAGKCANDFDRLNKLLTFAAQYRVHVVLKGAYSAVATPDGRLYFNMSGNPGMAKGGSGDVLTGVLLALAANGLEMEDVACIGVFAHGMAGDLLREEHGMRGMTAGLLAEGMGRVWSKLEGNEI